MCCRQGRVYPLLSFESHYQTIFHLERDKCIELNTNRNEYGTRHRVLTTINCTNSITQLKVKDLFNFFNSQPIGNEVYYVDPPASNTFNDLENYSMHFKGRQYKVSDFFVSAYLSLEKYQNSTIRFSTGLIEVPRGHTINTSFRYLTNGRNIEQREYEFKLLHYSRREDKVGFNFEKEDILIPNLDMTLTHPQMVNFVTDRAADFAALQVRWFFLSFWNF